ncbi:hypothetical protein ROJ8625_04095 [Roseivivax jejudonensis]|uniref:Uncharacterized protein n=1 Tax=Roseivivax jejudonensis TaxID=1529041 RepID=A0A1X7AB34_9RHOB|nr:hypothetical protein [Roseivivax jejudonensis]SLN74752.1 hypothetical protein ROJ8625_04095 [Roseivivax jejudonensis]
MDNPDMALGVEFFGKAVQNMRQSKDAGRPIFEDREYVRIRFPADNKRELVAPAHEVHYVTHAKAQMTYAERFPAAYEAFKKDAEAELVTGTPLAEMTSLTEAKRAELRAQNVRTVEQLAGLPDSSMRKLGMGSRDLVEAAQAYLKRAEGTSEVAALKARIAELESAQAPVAPAVDQFDGMTDDDLRNMLGDAGVQADRRWGRKRLIEEIETLAKAKEDAA